MTLLRAGAVTARAVPACACYAPGRAACFSTTSAAAVGPTTAAARARGRCTAVVGTKSNSTQAADVAFGARFAPGRVSAASAYRARLRAWRRSWRRAARVGAQQAAQPDVRQLRHLSAFAARNAASARARQRRLGGSPAPAQQEAVVQRVQLLRLGQLVGGAHHAQQRHARAPRAVVKRALVQQRQQRVQDAAVGLPAARASARDADAYAAVALQLDAL